MMGREEVEISQSVFPYSRVQVCTLGSIFPIKFLKNYMGSFCLENEACSISIIAYTKESNVSIKQLEWQMGTYVKEANC